MAQGEDEVDPLEALRARVDEVDQRLVDLLNERARVVVEIGELKREHKRAIYAPHREAEVLRRAVARNHGPLPERTILGVYRELMSGSFALEQPLRIGYVGPSCSFSHVAAVSHFGSSVSFEDLREVSGVVTELRRGHVQYGLLPIEPSVEGSVVDTIEALSSTRDELFVYAEVCLSLRHALLANAQPGAIDRIHGTPSAFRECARWLRTQYPHATWIPAIDAVSAVSLARREGDGGMGAAAVGPALAGRLHGVNVVFEDIEDHPDRTTRFYVLAREQAEPSGDDKTAIVFGVDDRPGALVRVLECFGRYRLGLTHLQQKPAPPGASSHVFVVEVRGHRRSPDVEDAIADARRDANELFVAGSFPRAQRPL